MSSVIKATHNSNRVIQQVAFNLEDLTQQAQQYLEQVRLQAAQIVVEAQKQADLVKKKAEEEGRNTARVAAEKILDEKVGKQMATLLPALQQVLADLNDAKQDWLRHWEQTAVQVAARMAEKIIRRELIQQPDVPVTLVRDALELAAGSAHLRIQLNPTDQQALRSSIDELLHEFNRVGQTEIVADANISQGGCRVTTQQGVIDAQIETQLQRLVDELLSENQD